MAFERQPTEIYKWIYCRFVAIVEKCTSYNNKASKCFVMQRRSGNWSDERFPLASSARLSEKTVVPFPCPL